ncbi:MAG: toll/interleukin-1 receptor domain-containing protein [Verrucomicrobiales bacterium]|nr:toll/interleukin-1 receptor domain-containing protein [Verrucomicrobiales bacterium]
MPLVVRRIVAIAGGLILPLVAFLWAVHGSGFAGNLFSHSHGLRSEIGPDAIYKKFADVYTFWGIFGISTAGGFAFAFLYWDRRPVQWKVQLCFWLFFFLILPLSVLNYWSADTYVSRSKQALIDLVLVFLGVVVVLLIARIKAKTIPARVLQWMAVYFIALQAVLIPAIYASLWWLNWQEAISAANTKDWTPGWISVTGAILAVFGATFLTSRFPNRVSVRPPRSVFISYRRKDSAEVVGRIYDRLCDQFGAEAVFKDVDSIPLGDDIHKHLDAAVRHAEVCIAIIGPNWMPPDQSGAREKPDFDFVQQEIECSLSHCIPIIPVFVHGGKFPPASEIPNSLHSLSRINGSIVRPDPDFETDMARLVRGIERTHSG